MIKDQATRNLNNFLSSYTLQESTELVNQVYDQLTEAMNDSPSKDRQERILDFIESIEEIIPAIYKLQSEHLIFENKR